MRPVLSMTLPLVLLSFCAAHTATDDPDMKKLAGSYHITSSQVDGEQRDQKLLKSLRVEMTAKGDYTLFFDDNKVGEGTFKVDSTADPKRMDLTYAERSEYNGKFEPKITSRGIYKIEGDKITTCFIRGEGKVYPTAFESKKDQNQALEVYERIKK